LGEGCANPGRSNFVRWRRLFSAQLLHFFIDIQQCVPVHVNKKKRRITVRFVRHSGIVVPQNGTGLGHPSGTQNLEVAPQLFFIYSRIFAQWCTAHSTFRMAVVLCYIPVHYVTSVFSIGVKAARACSCPPWCSQCGSYISTSPCSHVLGYRTDVSLDPLPASVAYFLKCTLVQALRCCTGRTAHMGSTGIPLLFLDHGTRRGLGGQRNAPVALYRRERPGTHCTGGWLGPRANLDGCGKSRPNRDSIPGPPSP
jgi:hypothetical protein